MGFEVEGQLNDAARYCPISFSGTYQAKYSVLESIEGCISPIPQKRLLDVFFAYL